MKLQLELPEGTTRAVRGIGKMGSAHTTNTVCTMRAGFALTRNGGKRIDGRGSRFGADHAGIGV